MSLVADYSDTNSSSSSDSESSDGNEKQPKSCASERSFLPSASSLLAKKAGEVFQNRYQQEEQAKKACLEQHVKMVENDDHLKTKNGKKICWNYRKGRCRFGSKCQYAHDSDLVTESTTMESVAIPKKPNDDKLTQQDDSSVSLTKEKRKRPGLGDSLTPGKRVMKAYIEQQQRS